MGDDYLSNGTVSHHHTPDCKRRSLYVGLVSSGALSGRLDEMLSTLDVITHSDTSGGVNSLALCESKKDMGVRCHRVDLVEGPFGCWLAVAAVMGCFRPRVAWPRNNRGLVSIHGSAAS
ncbi:uncharacterized protein ANIA_10458 [Aspergillus nidulans FGSC A4]|jgi:hypothetical protein|uniref:Uncharacterized protein n=1 Tax=Emericella nidulans (strain FGSC A4 / ATCC 38163 / CBS 112.46 / NRRL 194 / M139) TaxID=227321 RepID=C8V3T3_EMENI|nr:hypothetical protein [Aspergillus nidulans FGSC A4]CBF75638.1 TPA: hypothetical protein ANIA_10458 [Aspergillus nidulans FGSC A4]